MLTLIYYDENLSLSEAQALYPDATVIPTMRTRALLNHANTLLDGEYLTVDEEVFLRVLYNVREGNLCHKDVQFVAVYNSNGKVLSKTIPVTADGDLASRFPTADGFFHWRDRELF